MIKKILITILCFIALTGCVKKETPENPNEGSGEQVSVIEGESGGYSIITPYQSSPLRQIYSQNYREIDTIEIGRRLQEKSKKFFNPKDYLVSEGSVITIARYNELVNARSSSNPYGLNPEKNTQPFVEKIKNSEGKVTAEVTIPNPRFVRSLYEIDFYKDVNRSKLSGMSIAVVLNRHQVVDASLGTTKEISDDSLYQVANDMIAVQLNAYLRTLSETKEVPIMIAFYVQNSSLDNLAGNYLPGTYIGHALFEGSRDTATLTRDNEAWYLLNSSQASTYIPESYNTFSVFKNQINDFLKDESIGLVGSAFTIDNQVKEINISINLGAKTELEIYGLTQYISDKMSTLSRMDVPIVIHVKMFQSTRATIVSNPGSKPVVQFLY